MGQTEINKNHYVCILVLKWYKAFAVIVYNLKLLQAAVYIAQLCLLIRERL